MAKQAKPLYLTRTVTETVDLHDFCKQFADDAYNYISSHDTFGYYGNKKSLSSELSLLDFREILPNTWDFYKTIDLTPRVRIRAEIARQLNKRDWNLYFTVDRDEFCVIDLTDWLNPANEIVHIKYPLSDEIINRFNMKKSFKAYEVAQKSAFGGGKATVFDGNLLLVNGSQILSILSKSWLPSTKWFK